MKHHRASNGYIDVPPRYWSGQDYVRAIQLRANVLPTAGLPYNNGEDARCRAGCERRETLCHVLQKCPLMHWERIKRHDYVVKRLKNIATKKGWQVTEEPNIRDLSGRLLKPDLLMTKESSIVISDVSVSWEAPEPLGTAYRTKKAIYSEPAFLESVRSRYPGMEIKVCPLIVGARGGWCPENGEIVQLLGMADSNIADLVHTAIRGGVIIHQQFNRLIWRRGRRAN